MVSTDDFDTLLIVLLFGVLGIVIAMIFNAMNTAGVVVDEFVTGSVSITDLMAGTIVFFLIIGVVVAALKKP